MSEANKDFESCGIRITGHARESDGVCLTSVEFNEAKFLSMASEQRGAAAIALIEAAQVLLNDTFFGARLPMIIVQMQIEEDDGSLVPLVHSHQSH